MLKKLRKLIFGCANPVSHSDLPLLIDEASNSMADGAAKLRGSTERVKREASILNSLAETLKAAAGDRHVSQ